MIKQLEFLFEVYKRLFILHIETKTIDSQFHEKSQEFYEEMFAIVHEIAEKRQDIEADAPTDAKYWKEAYDLIEESKQIIEKMINTKNTPWMDNLLRSIADRLETQCGNARAFTK